MTVGLLAEKPSQARNYAKALGGMSGAYKGTDYVIVPARGHLFEFAKPESQVSSALASQYRSWDLNKLPWNERDLQWKRVKQKDVAGTLKDIKKALGACSEIVLACDVDPSGEGGLIAIEIIDELGLDNGRRKFSRMYHMDESEAEVRKAFEQRKPVPNLHTHDEYLKAWYRTRWDYLSMQWSRIATKCGDGRSVIREGRLKSSMVLLVGDQLKAVKNYKKVPFYTNKFRDENGVVYTNPEEPSYSKKTDVPQTYRASDVVLDSKAMKRTAPPKLLDLAALSSRLSGMPPKALLATYQKMYESQVVSYPRTEDKFITPEQFDELLPKVDAIARVVGADASKLTHRTPRKTHVKAGGAHGANRPGSNVPSSLADLDKFGKGAREIYVTLAKNYLAMLAEDYEYEQQKGHVKDYPKFVGSANVPKVMGWKGIFDADEDADEEDNAKGIGTHAEPFVHEGFPPKPQTPTRKWLMSQLEKYDVGTGATRVSTYADVTSTSAKYPLLKESRGKISMAKCGEMSYGLLPGTHIGDIKMTEQVQRQMEDVAAGKADADKLLHGIQQMVLDDIEVMKKNGEQMRKELGIMSEGNVEYAEGTWNGRTVRFKRTWGANDHWNGHTFTDAEIKRLLAGEQIEFEAVSRKGSTYTARGELDEGTFNGRSYVGFTLKFDSPQGQDPAYAYGTWNGEDIRFKKTWGANDKWPGHTFTEDEIEILLNGGEVEFEATSKGGRPYTARGGLAKSTYNGREFVGFKPNFG